MPASRDVYKRQSEHTMIGRFIDQTLDGAKLPLTLTSYSPCFRTVSYTHLDVYKRQAYGDTRAFTLPDGSERRLVVCKKISQTPTAYPRNRCV